MRKLLFFICLLNVKNTYASLTNFVASSDTTNVTYSFNYTDAPTHMRVFLDTDKSGTTGFPISGIGANYLIENSYLYSYTGTNGSWAWQFVKNVSFTQTTSYVKFIVARTDLKSPQALNVLAQYSNPVSNSAVVSQTLTSPLPAKITLPTSQMRLEQGYAYIVPVDSSLISDSSTAPTQSKLQLYENGIAIGPAHSTHDSIRTLGKGRFSHWGGSIRFAASDNTNPLKNKRTYSYAVLADSIPAPTPTPTPTPTPVPVTEVTFTPSSAAIVNPDRGFFWMTDCRANPKSVAALQAYRAQNGHSVIHCMWYLREFKNSPISQTVLDQLATQMDNVRAAGFKMILRFVYTSADTVDAPLSVVQNHLDQIKPILAKNDGDIISVVQTGIIGQWGEMSTSSNYGGPSTAEHWTARKAVIDKLLSVVPANRQVAVRTPAFKMNPYGAAPLSDAEAFTGTSRARVSQYNDCFMSSANDWGTYSNSIEKDFVKQESKYLAMSGETCADVSYNSCEVALKEMSDLHWSFLHEGYNTTVINKWKSYGCFETIQKRLGYRFALQSASIPTTASVGGKFSVKFIINNTGFAATANSRKVELVLRNTVSGAVFKLPVSADPRRWLPGSPITVTQDLTLPSTIPAGTYALLLNLPDSAPSLNSRPEYSIQLANESVWEATTGFNSLKASVVIGQ